MAFWNRDSSSPSPARPTPIDIKWSFEGSSNEIVTSVGAHNPDSMTDKDFAVLVAKAHALNFGDSDRSRGIKVKGWRKR